MAIADERHKIILHELKHREFITTNELVNILNTSRETIRRDINALSKAGKLEKVHGGVTSLESITNWENTSIALRTTLHVNEKKQLCEKAAGLISEKDTIFIDNSSTTSFILNYIPHNLNLTIITNSISLVNKHANNISPNWNIILLGGEFNYKNSSTHGYLATSTLEKFNPTICFISAHGISADFNFCDTNFFDVELKQLALDKSSKKVLMVDSHKFERKGSLNLAHASFFDTIITDLHKHETITKLKKACPIIEIINL